ncbi:hypothetical protein N8132_01360 [Candidatus Puniceispirillum sp.]|nr:hypothetical protein [Candidatus Puniceispirillum sp.]
MSYGTVLTMRQVVPVFPRFVQMPFASNVTPTQSTPTETCAPKMRRFNMIATMALDYACD